MVTTATPMVWTKVEESLPVIPVGCWRDHRMTLARSAKYGVLALWFTRGRIGEDGKGLYAGIGDQRLWLNSDHMQCEVEFLNDIIEWAELPS